MVFSKGYSKSKMSRRKLYKKGAFKASRSLTKRGYALYQSVKGFQKYNVHMFKRWATPDLLTINVGATQGNYSKAFALSETINNSELTVLYDQYKIMGVKVYFKLCTNPDGIHTNPNIIGGTSQTQNMFPKIWFSRDYDNISTETVDELRQRNTTKCKILRPNSFVSFYIRPALRNQVYLDGVTTATSPMWGQWLDCSSATVPHYGFKAAFDCESFAVNGSPYQIRVEYKYYLKFKNAR